MAKCTQYIKILVSSCNLYPCILIPKVWTLLSCVLKTEKNQKRNVFKYLQSYFYLKIKGTHILGMSTTHLQSTCLPIHQNFPCSDVWICQSTLFFSTTGGNPKGRQAGQTGLGGSCLWEKGLWQDRRLWGRAFWANRTGWTVWVWTFY